ncbi:MAG: glutamine-hydrolyzing GMP synthase subunit GuaA [Thermoplasmata archaeon]|nr:MAG: glutamine-hydrolyzing GMP synthase subunit GuaA [Thermoplasmata archaeon]
MFNPEKFVEEKIKELRNEIDDKAIIGASGGVDSTVAAVLASRAIGDKLVAVYVDTGFMRKGETEFVGDMLRKLDVNFKIYDAQNEYFEALKGVIDPEEKRAIIGEKFIRNFEKIAEKEKAVFLVQGTIAPDWIESGGGLRDTIKSHHNVGALPKDMDLKLVEPLRDNYKDEVRKVARFLKVPVSDRQPFPGPGLAVRIIGEATPEATKIVREACAIAEEEIDSASDKGEMERPWQYFAVLLPVKSVGVQGDIRAYGYTIVVRAVQSVDGMTAAYSKIPHHVLERISTRITNTMKDKVNRVVFDITNKPPGTIEWE